MDTPLGERAQLERNIHNDAEKHEAEDHAVLDEKFGNHCYDIHDEIISLFLSDHEALACCIHLGD